MSLRDLYQELILDHGNNPRHFGPVEEPCLTCQAHNPVCGDELVLKAVINDDIEQIKFTGQGCAISMASASMMCQQLNGLSRAKAKLVLEDFLRLLTQNSQEAANLGKLEVFSGVRQYPQRVKCATLAWRALESLLSSKDQSIITTE